MKDNSLSYGFEFLFLFYSFMPFQFCHLDFIYHFNVLFMEFPLIFCYLHFSNFTLMQLTFPTISISLQFYFLTFMFMQFILCTFIFLSFT